MFEKMNERVKKVTVFDVGFVKLSVFFFTIIVVKAFPQLVRINYSILIILVIACALKPLYTVWVKKS